MERSVRSPTKPGPSSFSFYRKECWTHLSSDPLRSLGSNYPVTVPLEWQSTRTSVFDGAAEPKVGPGTSSQRHPFGVPNTTLLPKRISSPLPLSIFYSLIYLLLQAWARLRDDYVLELDFHGTFSTLSGGSGRKGLFAPSKSSLLICGGTDTALCPGHRGDQTQEWTHRHPLLRDRGDSQSSSNEK